MRHFQAWKKWVFDWYYVITLDPIKIQAHYAPKNDLLNLIFVKDFYVAGTEMARNGHKMAVYEG